MIPLSVLDLSVVTTGTKPAAALRNSIDLARHVDGLGYVRYWLAEHHNLASVASPAPDVMIGQIAAVTKHIRVGSGGVMLPNHAPLVVAERFKMLEALFPGRIDLGLGRAPGTDGATAYALRSRLDRREGDDFLERLHELILWQTREFPSGHPYNNVVAMPDDTPLPPIWLLGSSDYSVGARRAGRHGLRVRASFCVLRCDRCDGALSQSFSALGLACEPARRSSRSPSSRPKPMRKPKSSPPLSTSTACAATAASICRCRASRRRWPILIPTRSAPRSGATARACSSAARRRCMKKLQPMIDASKPDELMMITAVYDHDARKKSYCLLAEAFGLEKAAA